MGEQPRRVLLRTAYTAYKLVLRVGGSTFRAPPTSMHEGPLAEPLQYPWRIKACSNPILADAGPNPMEPAPTFCTAVVSSSSLPSPLGSCLALDGVPRSALMWSAAAHFQAPLAPAWR